MARALAGDPSILLADEPIGNLDACRTLAESPGFTVVSLLTPAIGIGANMAIFSFVDSALLKPLPYADADRIVRVLEKPPGLPRNVLRR